jgi:hypothetical protein
VQNVTGRGTCRTRHARVISNGDFRLEISNRNFQLDGQDVLPMRAYFQQSLQRARLNASRVRLNPPTHNARHFVPAPAWQQGSLCASARASPQTRAASAARRRVSVASAGPAAPFRESRTTRPRRAAGSTRPRRAAGGGRGHLDLSPAPGCLASRGLLFVVIQSGRSQNNQ